MLAGTASASILLLYRIPGRLVTRIPRARLGNRWQRGNPRPLKRAPSKLARRGFVPLAFRVTPGLAKYNIHVRATPARHRLVSVARSRKAPCRGSHEPTFDHDSLSPGNRGHGVLPRVDLVPALVAASRAGSAARSGGQGGTPGGTHRLGGRSALCRRRVALPRREPGLALPHPGDAGARRVLLDGALRVPRCLDCVPSQRRCERGRGLCCRGQAWRLAPLGRARRTPRGRSLPRGSADRPQLAPSRW